MQSDRLDSLIQTDAQAMGLLHGSVPTRDVAPFTELGSVAEQMLAALISKTCLVISPKVSAYTAGNSLVYCGPDIPIRQLFSDSAEVKVATTIVVIYGHLQEELHYHTSHVISFVVEGTGWLYTESARIPARPGDLVVIPGGVRHLFNCDEGQRMIVFATEISDQPIDHQKNFYE